MHKSNTIKIHHKQKTACFVNGAHTHSCAKCQNEKVRGKTVTLFRVVVWGPPPPSTFSQANNSPPQLTREEVKGRGALLSDICKGTELRKVSVVNDRSAPLLDSKTQTPKSQTPTTEHPYIRLFQYLHQQQSQPKQQGAPSEEQHNTTSLEKPKRDGVATVGGGTVGGVPKLQPFPDVPPGRPPSTRAPAPRPPRHHHDNTNDSSPQASSPLETSHSQRALLLSPSPSTGTRHASSAPPPPFCRRGNAPSPPTSASSYREKPLPPTPNSTPPLPSKPPPSPGNNRRPPISGANPAPSTLAPPPQHYHITNGLTGSGGEAAPELPHRHNSLSNKRPAPSPGGHTPTRGPAPPPPPASPTPSQQGANRPPPAVRETAGRGAAPPGLSSTSRAGTREAPPPPPPPYRIHGSPSLL
ncbi:WAS/WASL-interacting protein family member 2-like isoform X1 [Solea senegalensis]|uniref:WAS/WASL-interacting protein family member 2-like isoform X1 n=1 Tax=Solea senegalensis TaxID=28829 RepID=A0AAV6RIJ9_SOLSE|nr:WAS/WASL-interacting protein family member 2-like isoform X1 [Solea senegalensis]